MDGSLYEQLIVLLTIPPGNLVYHLVLAFSIAGALPGALMLWQRSGMDAGRRMVIGLGWMLLAQLVLIINAGLAGFFTVFEAWLPVLDRAVYGFDLIILVWLWVFPRGSRQVTSASIILSVATLLLALLSGLWWSNQAAIQALNGSGLDLIWTGFFIVLTVAGGVALVLRRPAGYGFGLGMFSLLLLGQLVHAISPGPVGNFAGVIRLSQMAAFPMLLILPTRFSWDGESVIETPTGLDQAIYANIRTIATKSQPAEVCKAVTALVSQALQTRWCLMISPPDSNGHIHRYCCYDLQRGEHLGTATFDSQLVPVLSESLRQGRPLHLPAEGNIPDLNGFGKILNQPVIGSMLSAPILTRSGEIDKALVLLSGDLDSSWSAEDQNFLADIAASLTEIFEYKHEYLAQSEKLAQSSTHLKNIQRENEHLNQEINEIRAINLANERQLKEVQSVLDKALNELAKMKASQPQSKG